MPGYCWRHLNAGVFFIQAILICGLSSAPGRAQTAGFRVEISGADHLQPMLEAHLPILRAAAEGDMSDEAWQSLVQRTPEHIRELLATEGYFSATVRARADSSTGRPLARFDIDPGVPAHVSEVRLDFTGDIQRADGTSRQRIAALRQQWRLPAGDRFTQAAWDTAKTALLNALLEKDFPAARIVASLARIDPASASARLEITIDSGPAFTLGELDVHGLSRYPAELVARVNPLRPGEPYRQERLSELQSRLLDTGYFSSAFVTIDADPDVAANAPVRVELVEHPAKRLSLGVGASTDVGARLQMKWLNRHFLGEDWRLESVVRADRLSQLVQSEWYFRPVSADAFGGQLEGWIPSIAVALERLNLTGTEIDRIRHSARWSTPSRSNERVLSVSLLADRRTLPGLQTRTRQALIGGYAWTRRRFDQLLTPARGYAAGIDLSAGVGGSIREDRIARILVSGVWLRPVHPRWTLVARVQAGQISGARDDSVPEDLLFRTGGDQTVRGYGFGKLGVPRNEAIVGGNVMAMISTELIYRITPDWGVAVFHDAGDAALSWQALRWRRGVGVGARWRSPIGALHVDLARGLDQGETRLHFSVGYGF